MSSNVVSIINNQIINAIESGTAPWKKPWRLELTPESAKSGKAYSGINALLLSAIQSINCYTTGKWITFNQIKARKLHLNKGSRSAPVIFYKKFEKDETVKGEKIKKTIRCLKYFNVYNLSCTNEDPDKYIPVINDEFTADENAENLLKKIANKIPTILEGGKAAYRRNLIEGLEEIRIPPKQTFEKSQEYYSTLFHEIIHSTGHDSRLNREFGKVFADEKYSFEELVAEIGACYLMSFCGIDGTLENSAAYLKGWKEALSNNPNWIIKASKQATDAVNYLLGDESPFKRDELEDIAEAA